MRISENDSIALLPVSTNPTVKTIFKSLILSTDETDETEEQEGLLKEVSETPNNTQDVSGLFVFKITNELQLV